MVADIVLGQRLTYQSTSRNIGRYRFSFCRITFCDLKIVFRIIRSHYERRADLHFLQDQPVITSPDARRGTRSEIEFLSGRCDWWFFNGAKKSERGDDRSRSICIMLLHDNCLLLLFRCSSPSWPIIVKSDIYRERLTHNYYINLEWYNSGEFDVDFCLRKIRCKNLHVSFPFFANFFYSKVSMEITLS